MRSMVMPRRERDAIIGADATGQTAFLKEPRKGRKSEGFTGGFQSFAEQQIARGVIGDRQRVAVFFVA